MASASQPDSQPSTSSSSSSVVSESAGLKASATGALAARRRPAITPRIYPPLPATYLAVERERALAKLHAQVTACRACVLAGYLDAANAVAGFRGRIGDRALVIGQAPGHLSVERNRPFSGPGGRVLDTWLQRAGFAPGALHREVYIAALTRCDPGKNPHGGGDRKPSPPELALCRPYLERELELVRPRAILLVGGMAIATFKGAARLDDVIGTYDQREGVYVLPLPHPSGVSRWLNDPGRQALLARALDHLRGWREEWEAEGA